MNAPVFNFLVLWRRADLTKSLLPFATTTGLYSDTINTLPHKKSLAQFETSQSCMHIPHFRGKEVYIFKSEFQF